MTLIDLLGLAAGVCTTAAFVPQVLMVWRTRSARDISLGMYGLFVTGVALWLVYGVLAGAMPVMVANGVTLLLASAVLLMKLRFDRAARLLEAEMQQLTARVADTFETDRAP
ncbi:Sugar transporter SemiSWEET [Andreprevotia sp. IGB-42]|uniref:SemiSWEET transporter n=1 Tax=Andreprevotia sp. IGB-42 TaxID=2497473 RepID=UPI0013567ABE|nr:SemiSWEET transporter [Andreprevotia sp. IGB-42]KAF0814349.1 Sugar transporter SemiSWEET [Andreprevotia sp. IGB-42]